MKNDYKDKDGYMRCGICDNVLTKGQDEIYCDKSHFHKDKKQSYESLQSENEKLREQIKLMRCYLNCKLYPEICPVGVTCPCYKWQLRSE